MVSVAAQRFKELLEAHKEYEAGAYNFLYEVLNYALEVEKRNSRSKEHVTAKELANGFRLYAIKEFGLMAKFVLNEWGFKSTRDLGNAVFYLVDHDLMGATERDRVEDFDNVYDFDEVFDLGLHYTGKGEDLEAICVKRLKN